MVFFIELEQKIFPYKFHNLYGHTKKPRIAKAILRKKNGTGGLNLPDSGYTTKLQLSRQYDTVTKTEI